MTTRAYFIQTTPEEIRQRVAAGETVVYGVAGGQVAEGGNYLSGRGLKQQLITRHKDFEVRSVRRERAAVDG